MIDPKIVQVYLKPTPTTGEHPEDYESIQTWAVNEPILQALMAEMGRICKQADMGLDEATETVWRLGNVIAEMMVGSACGHLMAKEIGRLQAEVAAFKFGGEEHLN